jgi:hypothetical protein
MENKRPPIITAITIGSSSAFWQLHTEGNYAVYGREHESGKSDIYVIGRLPRKGEREFQPASAIAFFYSETGAIDALKRWASDPLPPAPPPKVRKSGDNRRNSNRKYKNQIGLGQLELDFKAQS